MTTWAIIPVKQLHESKRRLEHLLSAKARADLIHQFLDSLMAVLNEARGIDRVLVVTVDASVIRMAAKYGVEVLVEEDAKGLNAAVTLGVDLAVKSGATAALILPADLPFARVEDIDQMLAPLLGGRLPLIALTGDEMEEGTNALLLAPPGDFIFHYGPGSFRAHLAEAYARGRTLHVVNAPGLRFDLDTESDWMVFNGYLVGVADE